jgi:hypothetical protein
MKTKSFWYEESVHTEKSAYDSHNIAPMGVEFRITSHNSLTLDVYNMDACLMNTTIFIFDRRRSYSVVQTQCCVFQC